MRVSAQPESLIGSAKIRMPLPAPGDMSRLIGPREQDYDFTSWWLLRAGHSQGSRPPFPLDSRVANLVKLGLCPGVRAYHLLLGG